MSQVPETRVPKVQNKRFPKQQSQAAPETQRAPKPQNKEFPKRQAAPGPQNQKFKKQQDQIATDIDPSFELFRSMRKLRYLDDSRIPDVEFPLFQKFMKTNKGDVTAENFKQFKEDLEVFEKMQAELKLATIDEVAALMKKLNVNNSERKVFEEYLSKNGKNEVTKVGFEEFKEYLLNNRENEATEVGFEDFKAFKIWKLAQQNPVAPAKLTEKQSSVTVPKKTTPLKVLPSLPESVASPVLSEREMLKKMIQENILLLEQARGSVKDADFTKRKNLIAFLNEQMKSL